MSLVNTVAIIGSFRQHYESIMEVWQLFFGLGLEVTSPKGTPIIKENIPFVRFISDPAAWDDPMVQTVALHRILRADFVYVVAPQGYVGRTTCYEIGRIVQAQRPLFFSEHPVDLPVRVPHEHISGPTEIITMIRNNRFRPNPLYYNEGTEHTVFERDLLCGRYRGDDEFLG